MDSLRSLNFAKQTVRMDNRNSWIYMQRVITGLSAGLVIYMIQQWSDSGSAGRFFFSIFYPVIFYLMTLACLTSFSGCIAEEREQGTLQLILMTGIKPFSLIAGRASGKFFQIFYLYLLLIPSSMFAVTLGGISLEQILSLYIILSFWLFLVSSISIWASVFCSKKKEAVILSFGITLLIIAGITIGGASPFQRRNEVLLNSSVFTFFNYDMAFYLFFSFLFIFHAVRNFKYTALFPLSFIEDFESKLIKKTHLKNFEGMKKIKGHIRVRFFHSPIEEKDLYMNPKAAAFPTGANTSGVIIVILLLLAAMTLPVSFFFMFLWVVLASLVLTWRRILDTFNREIEENTFSTLFMLPLDAEELLDKKMSGARLYETTLRTCYFIITIPSCAFFITAGKFLPVFILVGVIALYRVMLYGTVMTCLKVRELTATTSFIINMFAILFYFSLPLLTIPLYTVGCIVLRKMCIKTMKELAAAG